MYQAWLWKKVFTEIEGLDGSYDVHIRVKDPTYVPWLAVEKVLRGGWTRNSFIYVIYISDWRMHQR